jgi:hypothetical protein
MEARFIYRNRLDARFYDASTGEMRGGPDKVIVYVDGVLCAMDREARITIPVSRWKLMEIGAACFLAAFKGKGRALRSLEPVPLPPRDVELAMEKNGDEISHHDEYIGREEELPEPAPEATHQGSYEAEWEHLIREIRDLSR